MTILNEPISVWRVYEWEILLDGWVLRYQPDSCKNAL